MPGAAELLLAGDPPSALFRRVVVFLQALVLALAFVGGTIRSFVPVG
jgi:hypothetical protein